VHLAYIWIVSHLSAKNYRNWWKFDEVLTKTNLLSFFGTRCIYLLCVLLYQSCMTAVGSVVAFDCNYNKQRLVLLLLYLFTLWVTEADS